MARKTLADMESVVNAAARNALSHTITINGKPVPAQGDYGDGEIAALGSVGGRQAIELMILKADWPNEPVRNDSIILPKRPNLRFRPSNVETSADGAHWIFNVAKIGA